MAVPRLRMRPRTSLFVVVFACEYVWASQKGGKKGRKTGRFS